MSDDPHRLGRFLDAQSDAYGAALTELRAGAKRSHWMWYVFPQVAGLGFSSTSRYYAIGSRGEAKAYLSHPVLGHRLRECAEAVMNVQGHSAREIFGSVDELKLRSCMTLFASLSDAGSIFHRVLDKYFAGGMDPRTREILATLPATGPPGGTGR